jgi:hypothetical protein
MTVASVGAQAPASSAKPRATSGKWTVPRTVDGQPNLQGVWANNAVTPLERPDAFKGRTTMTDAELEQLKKGAVDLFSGRQAGDLLGDRLIQEILKDPSLRPFDPDTGNYNSFWVVGRDWDNRTSLITDPADGRVPPLTEQAQKSRRGRQGPSGSPAGPEDLSLGVRCITYGVPSMLAGYNSYFEIRQSAGYVTIMQEMIHDVRIVPLDGRPHVSKDVRLWNGDSRGRWEGETLVVDTTNYSARGAIRGATESLHLIERFTRVSPETIEYSLTFDDPATWTKPWTAMIRLKTTPEKIYEYACHEGNHSIVGILAGAREQEKATASKNSKSK